VIEDLDGIAPIIPDTPAPETPDDLDETQLKVWTFLQERRSVDQLARELALSIGELSRVLMALEIKSVIRRLPGNVYERQ
jgi:predicted Rossmann fold nucleotide-binding protein DprA/Smf involved in DNA uptake